MASADEVRAQLTRLGLATSGDKKACVRRLKDFVIAGGNGEGGAAVDDAQSWRQRPSC